MRPAALLLLLAPVLASAAEIRSIRIGGAEYVSLEDEAALLGLSVERLAPQPALMLKDGARPVARLADNSREIDLNGLRLFLGDPVLVRGGAFFLSRVDCERRLLPRLRPGLCGPPPAPPRVIAIDPGHGGTDKGATNKALGTMEKTYTLDVSLKLKRLLEAAGYAVVLTRDSDFDLPLALRSELANRAKADLFVSVHFNSLFPNTKTTGAEVFTFPPRTQASTDSWGLGNKRDAESEESPVNKFDAWNTILAGALHRRVLDALQDGDRGEKLRHLGVLRGLKCPGALVESAFISSDKEGALLAKPEFRDKIAEAIFAGIQDYAKAITALQPAAPSAAPTQRAQPSRPAAGP
jgi:N-acetylmuramoyl-L-alanine amidase